MSIGDFCTCTANLGHNTSWICPAHGVMGMLSEPAINLHHLSPQPDTIPGYDENGNLVYRTVAEWTKPGPKDARIAELEAENKRLSLAGHKMLDTIERLQSKPRLGKRKTLRELRDWAAESRHTAVYDLRLDLLDKINEMMAEGKDERT